MNLSASIMSLKWMMPHAEIFARANDNGSREPVIVNHLPVIPPAGITAIIIGSILVCALVAFFAISLVRAKKATKKVKTSNTKKKQFQPKKLSPLIRRYSPPRRQL